jgi:hypothetical protein
METSAPKRPGERWAAVKDRLGIAGAILLLLLLFVMLVDGAVVNHQCSVTEFLGSECSRWDARFRPWDEVTHR